MVNIEKSDATHQSVILKQAADYLKAIGLVNKLSEAETTQFVEICRAFQLNPFMREIYASKYGDTFSIVVGYETYIKRAERTGKLTGWGMTTTGTVKDNSLKAIITIHRKDWQHPFVHEVYYSEYVQRTKAGEINKFWREKPVTMTKKVAISQGFRLCFSVEIGGLPYTAEEIVTEDAIYQDVITALDDNDEIRRAIEEIGVCEDLACLKSTWAKHRKLQKNADFYNAKEKKKQNLTKKEVTNDNSNQ